MISDLMIASVVILSLAVLAGWLGLRLGRFLDRSRLVVFAGATLSSALYASFIVGRLELTQLLSVSSAILISNLTPILICFATGMAWTFPEQRGHRHTLIFSFAVSLSITFLFAPLLRAKVSPVVLAEPSRWSGDVCVQSHSATCGAAAAVTLLRHHGIEAEEAALIEQCLTSRGGTEPLGLYRGLMTQTRGGELMPKLADRQLNRWQSQQFPLIALVYFGDEVIQWGGGASPRLFGRRESGHAVVILKRLDNGKYLVGDPAFGETVWDAPTLQRRYTGQSLYLGPR